MSNFTKEQIIDKISEGRKYNEEKHGTKKEYIMNKIIPQADVALAQLRVERLQALEKAQDELNAVPKSALEFLKIGAIQALSAEINKVSNEQALVDGESIKL